MAAAITIQRPEVYPAGTAVKVFVLPNPIPGELVKNNSGNPEAWKPTLTKLGEWTVGASGKLEMFSMQKGVRYLLWASVNATDTFLTLTPPLVGVSTTSTSGDPRTVAVLTTSTQILPANAFREGLSVENEGPNPIYIGIAGGAAVLKDDIGPIAVGGSWDGRFAGVLWTGAVYGIAETGTSNAAVVEI